MISQRQRDLVEKLCRDAKLEIPNEIVLIACTAIADRDAVLKLCTELAEQYKKNCVSSDAAEKIFKEIQYWKEGLR